VAGDSPEGADNEPGREVGSRSIEFGRELHSHLLGPGDDLGRDTLAQGAQGPGRSPRGPPSMRAPDAPGGPPSFPGRGGWRG